MTRISTAELGRYLLSGRMSRAGCLSLPRQLPAGRSVPRALYGSSLRLARLLHAASGPEVSQPAERPFVPLRKKLKDEAKRLKKDGGGKKPKGSNQTVEGWELTVGIEIHAQLNTAKKLFSPAATSFNDEPNSHVALFDVAMPGSQPIFQREALLPALRAALTLDCEIQPVSRFDRKHYFWWDQPAGYQITQYYEPFARDGRVELHARDGIAAEDGEEVVVGIERVQMEQDTAKTVAQPGGEHWLDFNRVGVPLIEIITRPEIRHPRTAAALVRKVQLLLGSVDSCVSGMEAGGLRADVNVSVRRVGDTSGRLGTRTEIKNLSTIKAVEDAIIAERDRQIRELEAGGVIVGETRGWTLGAKETRRLRGKEGEVDYRYMPDPDLGPLVIGEDLLDYLRSSAAVSPDEELDILIGKYGLTAKDALSLMTLDNGGRVEFFYNVVDLLEERTKAGERDDGPPPELKSYAVLAGNWILHELGRLTVDKPHPDGLVRELEFTPDGKCIQIPAEELAELLHHLHQHRITGRVAKDLVVAMYLGRLSSGGVTATIDEHGLWFQEMDEGEYALLAERAAEGEEAVLRDFFGGKAYPHGKLMYLVGKMMRLGPSERIHPLNAEKAMKAKVEELVRDMQT